MLAIAIVVPIADVAGGRAVPPPRLQQPNDLAIADRDWQLAEFLRRAGVDFLGDGAGHGRRHPKKAKERAAAHGKTPAKSVSWGKHPAYRCDTQQAGSWLHIWPAREKFVAAIGRHGRIGHRCDRGAANGE